MKNLGFYAVIVIALIIAYSVMFADNAFIPEYGMPSGTEVLYEGEVPEPTEGENYYDGLSDYQKMIYKALEGGISRGEAEIKLTNVDLKSFENAVYEASLAIQYDHPEYFWYRGGYRYTTFKTPAAGVVNVEFSPTYYQYVTQFFDEGIKREELEKAVERVVLLALGHSSDPYEQLIFVHDYLIKNAYYDKAALNEFYKTNHAPSCEYIFSAYGCLVNGRTVCSGYAKAFQMITRGLGFECVYVTGKAGEAHGWNCIYIDGEGYYVDVTWDDHDISGDPPFYNYAFIDTDELNKTHTVDMVFEEPVCTAEEYNYFIKRGYYTETYDFNRVAEIYEQQKDRGVVHVKFGSAEELDKAYKALALNSEFRKIEGIKRFSKYSVNEKHYTLTFIK